MIEAHPKPTHPEYGLVGGAAVAVFVNEPVQAAAETAACALIEEQGWEVVEIAESYAVERDQYEAGSESLERFDQARVDGIVARFHRWPVGAED
jgi:hypothetical protein